MNRVVRSTSVPMAELPSPGMRCPSQWPGTARSVASAGRSLIMIPEGRKREAVLRLLRGEPLAIVARELAVTAAELSGWRDVFLDAGSAGLKSLVRDDRDATIGRLRTKVGELTMDTELLHAKIERLEAGGDGAPFGGRRSKR